LEREGETAVATMDLWTYRKSGWRDIDLVGFDVETLDGGIGKIDEATYEVGSSYVVVDTGHWILGQKVVLPAGLIERVDVDERRVFVQRTKDEIKSSPEFDESMYGNTAYREQIGSYYGPGGAGYRGGLAGDPNERPPKGWPGTGGQEE
jgi:hypothetical protein